jgi:hypothetical protein
MRLSDSYGVRDAACPISTGVRRDGATCVYSSFATCRGASPCQAGRPVARAHTGRGTPAPRSAPSGGGPTSCSSSVVLYSAARNRALSLCGPAESYCRLLKARVQRARAGMSGARGTPARRAALSRLQPGADEERVVGVEDVGSAHVRRLVCIHLLETHRVAACSLGRATQAAGNALQEGEADKHWLVRLTRGS